MDLMAVQSLSNDANVLYSVLDGAAIGLVARSQIVQVRRWTDPPWRDPIRLHDRLLM
jgi:hypothetical protein